MRLILLTELGFLCSSLCDGAVVVIDDFSVTTIEGFDIDTQLIYLAQLRLTVAKRWNVRQYCRL